MAALNMPGFVSQNAGQFVLAVGADNGADIDKHPVAVGNKCVQCRIVDDINLSGMKSYPRRVKNRPQRLMQKDFGFFIGNQRNGCGGSAI